MVGQTHLRLAPDASDDAQAAWVAALAAQLTGSEVALVRSALEWVAPKLAGTKLASGEPLLAHALGAATSLQALKLDGESLAAVLLMHVPEARETALEMRTRFGARVADLAEGAARMATIEQLGSRAAHQDRDQHLA